MSNEIALSTFLSKDDVKNRFKDILGARADAFMSSIISATKSNKSLAACDPRSVISSAVIAATLNLPIEQNLGFAAIVPYNNEAQFQMMWKGFVQLAIRTGQYKNINAAIIYEGELVEHNRITGDITIDPNKKIGNTIVGYVAYFRLISGFEKYYYMTKEEVEKHGKKYSKSFAKENSKWQQDFDAMALKTVIKMLLSKYGILSVEMQTAIKADQSVVKDGLTSNTEDIDFTYDDNPNVEDSEEVKATSTTEAIETQLTKETVKPVVDEYAAFRELWGEPNQRNADQFDALNRVFKTTPEGRMVEAYSKCGLKTFLDLSDFIAESTVEEIVAVKKYLKIK